MKIFTQEGLKSIKVVSQEFVDLDDAYTGEEICVGEDGKDYELYENNFQVLAVLILGQ